MSIYSDLQKIFPKKDAIAVKGLAEEFEQSLNSHRLRKKDKPDLKRSKVNVQKKIKRIDQFTKFLIDDLYPYLDNHVLDMQHPEKVEKERLVLLTILDCYLDRLDFDLSRIKKNTPNYRPKDFIRISFCEEMIILLNNHLDLPPKLSRDETPFNKYISYGLSCLEGSKAPPVDQIYPIIKPIVTMFNSMGFLEDMAEIHKHWETHSVIIK